MLSKKRIRNEQNCERNVRKTAKDSGKQYVSVKGVIKPAKVLQALCSCRKKCFEKINEDDRRNLFEQFYKLPVESQNQYISDNVEESEKKTERLRTNKERSRRNFSRKYFLKPRNGDEKVEVCQIMFLNTLSVTLMKVRHIVEKERHTGTNMYPPDGRGKHGHQRKLSIETKQTVIHHINMFPAYESHYSRNRTQKKYLSSDLSIAKMYRLYESYCNENNVEKTSEAMYRKIFTEHFNLSFKKPKNDTCEKCDKYTLLMRSSSNEEEKAEISRQQKLHLDLAESSYKEKSKDKEASLKDSKIAFANFDLEKCLPTPFLQNNVSFYKRSLWTFNLTFYSVINQQTDSTCYIWDETLAQRGGEEIASCIRQHLIDLPEKVEEITLFSDSCTGQNRNIYVATMYLHFLEECQSNVTKPKNLKTINQKFLQPGHTHMEADTIHAAIEKEKKHTTMKIDLPRDWANLIPSVQRRRPIKVVEMQQQQFVSFKKLLAQKFVHRKENTDKEKIPWLQIKWLQFRKEEPGKFFYKLSFSENELFKTLDVSRKRGFRTTGNTLQLTSLYSGALSLPAKKVADLQCLLPYIHESSRPFYASIAANQATEDDTMCDDGASENESDESQ